MKNFFNNHLWTKLNWFYFIYSKIKIICVFKFHFHLFNIFFLFLITYFWTFIPETSFFLSFISKLYFSDIFNLTLLLITSFCIYWIRTTCLCILWFVMFCFQIFQTWKSSFCIYWIPQVCFCLFFIFNAYFSDIKYFQLETCATNIILRLLNSKNMFVYSLICNVLFSNISDLKIFILRLLNSTSMFLSFFYFQFKHLFLRYKRSIFRFTHFGNLTFEFIDLQIFAD